jgi:GT2 family glycosyltransferase
MKHMNDLGIVAIGRNEGERLRRCLASLLGNGEGLKAVYVDSGSTDGSVELARSLGVEVVELDLARPFSAARARNAGFERLKQVAPGIRYVLFVDGDCEVVDGWIERAKAEFERRPKAGVVCGRRREMYPEHSIYNRLADLEWDTPIGEAVACGGDAMMRAEAFEVVGGFDPTAAAGEEPELCQRLRRQGWSVWRIDAEMTRHDLGMTRFRQWWRRQYRSGYNGLDIATRFPGEDKLFVAALIRARVWGIGWPLVVVVAGLIGWLMAGAVGALVGGGLAILLMPLQVLRLAAKIRKRVDGPRTALAYGTLTMVAKWGDLAGQVGYILDRRQGRMARLIEYKRVDESREAPPLVARAEARP